MSRKWERVFFICCFLTQGASYISAAAYGAMHRLHHAYTDRAGDPHSPHNAKGPINLMWITRNKYFAIWSGAMVVEDKYLKGLPQWPRFEKIAHNWITRVMWALAYFTFYYFFVTAWWQWLLLPLTIAMSPLHGVAVNWWAHKFGYENYKMENTSKNILPIDFLFLGEAYHNNHHMYPGRPNNAVRWFEWDITFAVVKLLSKFNVIKLR